ncbi:branched-chain amino acid ABC transporter permease [Pusillimonas sp.]|uniref:branched-chain amino acid ABC transporter permease n=1 Tax=Pusillimonas sp. TaxID=3040095 RepID=UPI0037CB7802
MLINGIAVLLDGFAYGALLFLMSVGLSITLGLMGFVNLAHMAIAMLGGYALISGTSMLGLSFFPALLLAIVLTSIFGILIERGLFRFVYGAPPLAQVLLTVGALFMIAAAVTYIWGPGLQAVAIPEFLEGRLRVGPFGFSRYRLFLLVVGVVVLVLLQAGMIRTRFGAMVRASVDDQDVARSLGIPVDKVFMGAFAVGSALAALGGALSVQAMGLDPSFGLKYLVLALLIVVLGGPGSIMGTFLSSMLIGIAMIASSYYVPAIGAFVIYLVMIIVLTLRPTGLGSMRRRHP